MYRPWAYLLGILLIAGLLTGCGGSSGSSSSTSLSGDTPATSLSVNLSTSAAAIIAGQGVTLTWTSSANATSVSASNFGAAAVNGTVRLFPTATTPYSITVIGTEGQSTSTVTVTVSAPQPPIVVSGFGTAIYTPGTGFLVQLTVTPNTTTQSYTVEDTLPLGWTATNIGSNGTLSNTANNNVQVNWGPISGAATTVLSYTAVPPAVPPANTSDIVTFSGTATFDSAAPVTIFGDRTLGTKSRVRR